MFARDHITVERLRQVLSYDAQSGEFRWAVHINNRIQIGQLAGYVNGGYLRISVDGITYLAHRLAWLYVTGVWPLSQIDHRDEDGLNNAFANLRQATASQNRCNRGAQSNNRSGFKGVSWFRKTKKWRARIRINGRAKTLGYFADPSEAHEFYGLAAAMLHGEFANPGRSAAHLAQ